MTPFVLAVCESSVSACGFDAGRNTKSVEDAIAVCGAGGAGLKQVGALDWRKGSSFNILDSLSVLTSK